MSARDTKLVTWNERYSVGIPSIDAQHRRLIDLTNELYSAFLAGEANQVLERILEGVDDYTTSHFTAEEQLMRKHRFPRYAHHKAEHDKLLAHVKYLREASRTGKAMLTQEVLAFLQHWLLSHIIGIDKKYSAHLLEAGVR